MAVKPHSFLLHRYAGAIKQPAFVAVSRQLTRWVRYPLRDSASFIEGLRLRGASIAVTLEELSHDDL